jgi:outer membrane protein, heavy metal efflux system
MFCHIARERIRRTTCVVLPWVGGLVAAILTIEAAAQTVWVPRRLSLDHAERLMMERNLPVVAGRYQVEANRAAQLVASLKPVSTVTVSAESFMILPPAIAGPAGGGPIAGTRRDRFLFLRTDSDAGAIPSYMVSFDKLIERGGKRELRTSQADSEIDAAEADMLDAVRSQLFELRKAFIEAILARENRVLAQRIFEQYNRIKELTEVRVLAGESPGAELYRVRAGELEFQRALLETQTEYEQATRDLLRLLGARPEEVEPARVDLAHLNRPGAAAGQEAPGFSGLDGASLLEILGYFLDRPLPLELPELRRMALESRPDVLAARHRYRSADTGLRLARSVGTRDLGVSTAFQRIGSDNTFGLAFQVPVFLDKTARAATAEAEALRRVAETYQRHAEIVALSEVEKAYQQHLAARRTLDIYNLRNLDQVEKLQQIAVFTYQEGAASMFEVLDAQRTYNETLTAYNRARADYHISLYQMEQAAGVPLW